MHFVTKFTFVGISKLGDLPHRTYAVYADSHVVSSLSHDIPPALLVTESQLLAMILNRFLHLCSIWLLKSNHVEKLPHPSQPMHQKSGIEIRFLDNKKTQQNKERFLEAWEVEVTFKPARFLWALSFGVAYRSAALAPIEAARSRTKKH